MKAKRKKIYPRWVQMAPATKGVDPADVQRLLWMALPTMSVGWVVDPNADDVQQNKAGTNAGSKNALKAVDPSLCIPSFKLIGQRFSAWAFFSSLRRRSLSS